MQHFPILSLIFLCAPLVAQDPSSRPAAQDEIILGQGSHRYRWERGFGQMPEGRDLGNTHGCIQVDKAGRIYANTDTEQAVVIFSAAGKFLGAWGKEFKGGLHGMTLVEEGGKEFFYLTHTRRGEVVKTTLEGEVLWTLGYPKESGVYKNGKRYRPTSVAVTPQGAIYVADGYGRSWIHQFDKDRRYVRSFGGPGKLPHNLRCPHGIFYDTRGETPRLMVADRENHRLQLFSLEGKHLGQIAGMLRRPCNIQRFGDDLVVADLCGRVTLLDGEDKLICHLGDNPDKRLWAKNPIPRSKWQDGLFISPHSACFDHQGNLYVMDWLRAGRLTQLRRIPVPAKIPGRKVPGTTGPGR